MVARSRHISGTAAGGYMQQDPTGSRRLVWISLRRKVPRIHVFEFFFQVSHRDLTVKGRYSLLLHRACFQGDLFPS